jgi:cytochrome c oxidase cbb3-type subunit IV
MELEWMRSLMTLAAFVTFIGIVAWAWSGRKRGDFEAAARSVLIEGEDEGGRPRQRVQTTHSTGSQP